MINLPTTTPRRKGRLGSRIKSTAGCITCKIRKVKCDEEKPFCQRCVSTGRKCDGYAERVESRISTSAVVQSIPRLNHVSSYADVDAIELQSFEFFVLQVLPGFSRIVDQHFWHQIVPQLSRLDKVVWHAVNALACLIRYCPLSRRWLLLGRTKSAVTDHNHRTALIWYNKSLSGLREHIACGNISPGKIMMTCILYTCIECLQDNLDETMVLYQKATVMAQTPGASTLIEDSQGAPASDITLTTITLAQLRHMSISLGLPLSWTKIKDHCNASFESWSQAREMGYAILAETHQFIVKIAEIRLTQKTKDWTPPTDHVCQWNYLSKTLQRWKDTLHELYCRASLDLNLLEGREEQYSTLMLSCNHYTIWLSIFWRPDQTAYDEFIPHFRAMIDYARRVLALQNSRADRPVFVFETRVLPALFFVASRCRHPGVRRDAILLLENEAPQMEYYFKAAAMAELAKTLVGIEEGGGDELGVYKADYAPELCDILVPEEHRVYRDQVIVVADSETGLPVQYLSYSIWRRDGEDGTCTSHDHKIRLRS